MKNLKNIIMSSSDLIRRSRGNKALDTAGFPLSLRSAGMTVLFLLTLGFAIPTWATPCAGGAGTVVTGLDGVDYCQSIKSMNWWSAIAWCDAIGMAPVSVEDCHGANNTITGDSQCPNFEDRGSNIVWTSSISYSSNPYIIYFSGGTLVDNRWKTDTYYYALCKPKSNNN